MRQIGSLLKSFISITNLELMWIKIESFLKSKDNINILAWTEKDTNDLRKSLMGQDLNHPLIRIMDRASTGAIQKLYSYYERFEQQLGLLNKEIPNIISIIPDDTGFFDDIKFGDEGFVIIYRKFRISGNNILKITTILHDYDSYDKSNPTSKLIPVLKEMTNKYIEYKEKNNKRSERGEKKIPYDEIKKTLTNIYNNGMKRR